MPLFDVAIVGGGPAGTALAIRLARGGLSVALWNHAPAARPPLGETLSPETAAALAELGVGEAFAAAGHLPSPGILRAWETAEPRETDHLFNPFGCGWRLDRPAFDALLLDAAEAAGAVVRRQTRIADCRRAAGGWELVVRDRQDAHAAARAARAVVHPCRARFLVDATGRAAALARRQAAVRPRHDALVAVAGLLPARRDDPRLALEACEVGWWHSGPLPGGKLVAVLMTDADLLPRSTAALRGFWLACLRRAPLTSAGRHGRVGRARTGANALGAPTDPGADAAGSPTAPLRCVLADTARTLPACGRDWLAVGDAAASFDPLSARGIPHAFESARRAAEAVAEALDGRPSSLDDYAAWLADDFTSYLSLRRHYYAQVARFPNAPFWRRRAAVVAEAAPPYL